MRARRASSLLAALALLSPLVAIAVPECAPGPHCPMAGLMGEEMPCHGASMQADDCCPADGAAEPAAAVPLISASALTADDGAPAPLTVDGEEPSAVACGVGHSTPLYRLFRALLI